MKLLYSLILCCTAFLTQVCSACEILDSYSSQISYVSPGRDMRNYRNCWYIDPPEDSIIRLKLVKLDLNDPYCDSVYILLSDDAGRREKICQHNPYSDWRNKTVTMTGAVNVTLIMRYTWDYVSFLLEYEAEMKNCNKDHFRCSSYQCIRYEQVCDGVEDCENGLDERDCGIFSNYGINISRKNSINWLKDRQTNFGWGRNTHRAVTSLYLTGAAEFQGQNITEEIIIKQLQLKTAASLLRNLTDPMSINELSMYVNALLVTCHNVRNVFGEDLLKILADRAFSSSPAVPGAYLTLCNAKWSFSERNVQQLSNLLTKDLDYPFALEIRAMTIMALSCLKQKTSIFNSMYNASSVYNETVEYLMKNQKQDGSFGNVHTSAVVIQALISSGQTENRQWNVEIAMKFLIQSLNSSSVDFLSVYLSLPLFKGKTLVDISSVDCSTNQRKLEEDEDILDVTDKLSAKVHVQYSLYIGDNKNVMHNLYLKVSENSTVYDVMRIAQIADQKYKFSHHENNGHFYIYELAGLTNDIEAGKFWQSYTLSSNNSELKQFILSPDQVIVRDKEHLIMWYKSLSV